MTRRLANGGVRARATGAHLAILSLAAVLLWMATWDALALGGERASAARSSQRLRRLPPVGNDSSAAGAEVGLVSTWDVSAEPADQDGESLTSAEESIREPGSGGSGELGRANRLGEAPESTRELFLRRQTVLLEPGQLQFDIGLAYSVTNQQLPVALTDQAGTIEGVAGGRIRQRLLTMPFEIRYGLLRRMQVYLNAPVGWSGTELSFSGFDEFSNIGGIGDMRIGTSVLLKEGSGNGPQVVGTFDFTFPTGNDSFVQYGLSPGAKLGEGFFALATTVLFIHNYDPLVLFYGGGYRQRFADSSLGFDIVPGAQILYEGGVGFAATDRVTLSGSLLGAYISENYIDGRRIEGSNLEPLRLRFAVTLSNPERQLHVWRGVRRVKEIVEPFAEIGMTPETPARFGVIWTY